MPCWCVDLSMYAHVMSPQSGKQGTWSFACTRTEALTPRGPRGRPGPLTMMLLYMLPLSSSTLMRMMHVSSFCWLYTGGSAVEAMDVTEMERLWILGLLLQDGGEARGWTKDDIPEEFVSMEWIEEQEEDDSESWKRKQTAEGNAAVRTVADTVLPNCQSRDVATNKPQSFPPQPPTRLLSLR